MCQSVINHSKSFIFFLNQESELCKNYYGETAETITSIFKSFILNWMILLYFRMKEICKYILVGVFAFKVEEQVETKKTRGLPRWLHGKDSTCQYRDVGDVGLIPRLRRYPGVGNGNPFQYSCLENSMDRGAWRATVHGFTKSWPWLSDWAWIHKKYRCLLFSIIYMRKQKKKKGLDLKHFSLVPTLLRARSNLVQVT